MSITDDGLSRRIVSWLGLSLLPDDVGTWSAGEISEHLYWSTPSTVLRRLRALRDEGRVIEVNGPRGSLWRLP